MLTGGEISLVRSNSCSSLVRAFDLCLAQVSLSKILKLFQILAPLVYERVWMVSAPQLQKYYTATSVWVWIDECTLRSHWTWQGQYASQWTNYTLAKEHLKWTVWDNVIFFYNIVSIHGCGNKITFFRVKPYLWPTLSNANFNISVFTSYYFTIIKVLNDEFQNNLYKVRLCQP